MWTQYKQVLPQGSWAVGCLFKLGELASCSWLWPLLSFGTRGSVVGVAGAGLQFGRSGFEGLKWTFSVRALWAQRLSHVQLFATPWTVARQSLLSVGFPRQEYQSGLPGPPPGDLPDPGIEPVSPVSPVLGGRVFTTETPGEAFLLCVWGKIFLCPGPQFPHLCMNEWGEPSCKAS